jgi:hypothetical protein
MVETVTALKDMAARWANAKAAERANAQSYLIELCEALELPRPQPAGSGYEFEFAVTIMARDGSETSGFVDCYRQAHFVLEAKDFAEGKGSDLALRRAYGQARMYASNDPSGVAPPYVLVLDVARTLSVYHRWGGTYQGFSAGHRIDLSTLHEREQDIALLRDIWLDPSKRDPRITAQAVTTEIAGHLAQLAATLEDRGFEPERVARFLMRIVFSCFAEDVALLPRDAFRQTVQNAGINGSPELLAKALEALWKAMDSGGLFGYEQLLRFNGSFFRDAEALPLTREEVAQVLAAARADWTNVEPSIFGTLLTRALDPEERHRLGAEYTPRHFIERLVRPTVEEPVRERWTAVQVEVLQLRETGKAKDRARAEERLREFLAWMRGLRVLDPACGSGNFLYVTMHLLKDIEYEAIQELSALTGKHELRMEEMGPQNFLGLEVKAWAREIAELVLWIGFHQYWRRHHHVQPPEPVLQDTGTLECRDAVLTWDAIVRDPLRDRLDPTPRIRHPVTHELVPDPSAMLPYLEHRGASIAPWPQADFIIGNPPYLGQARQRDVFGDGYVDALRAAYTTLPDSVDFVMYWWHRAAQAVASGATLRAGLITTSSITQVWNRDAVASAIERGARVIWAIPDHPWVDESGSADVRVAMTVLSTEAIAAVRFEVNAEGVIVSEQRAPRLNADLTAHADVARAAQARLSANKGLAAQGLGLRGGGFLLEHEEAQTLLRADPRHGDIVRPYRNGRDIAARPRGVYVIDFGMMSEEQARDFPMLFDIVRTRVKPDRDAHARESIRRYWWRHGWPRVELREAAAGLRRYIVTVGTAKHRFFTFLDASVAPDEKLVCIGSDDAFVLGVLSSGVHGAWALAAGGRLGVGNDPVYVKTTCFDPFPFPDPILAQRQAIAAVAERLEGHRQAALARDERVTMTGLYNVVEKLRAGEALTAKERIVHDAAACGMLRDLHDELDRLVAAAYDWDWPLPLALILERLVLLHDERVREEQAGKVRWIRPAYQGPRFGTLNVAPLALDVDQSESATAPVASAPPPWPRDAIEQISAIRAIVAQQPRSAEDVSRQFTGARREIVVRHLDTLTMLGEMIRDDSGTYRVATGPLATI